MAGVRLEEPRGFFCGAARFCTALSGSQPAAPRQCGAAAQPPVHSQGQCAFEAQVKPHCDFRATTAFLSVVAIGLIVDAVVRLVLIRLRIRAVHELLQPSCMSGCETHGAHAHKRPQTSRMDGPNFDFFFFALDAGVAAFFAVVGEACFFFVVDEFACFFAGGCCTGATGAGVTGAGGMASFALARLRIFFAVGGDGGERTVLLDTSAKSFTLRLRSLSTKNAGSNTLLSLRLMLFVPAAVLAGASVIALAGASMVRRRPVTLSGVVGASGDCRRCRLPESRSFSSARHFSLAHALHDEHALVTVGDNLLGRLLSSPLRDAALANSHRSNGSGGWRRNQTTRMCRRAARRWRRRCFVRMAVRIRILAFLCKSVVLFQRLQARRRVKLAATQCGRCKTLTSRNAAASASLAGMWSFSISRSPMLHRLRVDTQPMVSSMGKLKKRTRSSCERVSE